MFHNINFLYLYLFLTVFIILLKKTSTLSSLLVVAVFIFFLYIDLENSNSFYVVLGLALSSLVYAYVDNNEDILLLPTLSAIPLVISGDLTVKALLGISVYSSIFIVRKGERNVASVLNFLIGLIAFLFVAHRTPSQTLNYIFDGPEVDFIICLLMLKLTILIVKLLHNTEVKSKFIIFYEVFLISTLANYLFKIQPIDVYAYGHYFLVIVYFLIPVLMLIFRGRLSCNITKMKTFLFLFVSFLLVTDSVKLEHSVMAFTSLLIIFSLIEWGGRAIPLQIKNYLFIFMFVFVLNTFDVVANMSTFLLPFILFSFCIFLISSTRENINLDVN